MFLSLSHMGVIGIRTFSAGEKVPATCELIQVLPLSGGVGCCLHESPERGENFLNATQPAPVPLTSLSPLRYRLPREGRGRREAEGNGPGLRDPKENPVTARKGC